MSTDHIQIGRVFGDKDRLHRVVRITELTPMTSPLHGLAEIPTVVFEIWDTHESEEPWSRSSFISRGDFERCYRYLPEHVLNTQFELTEAQQMLNAASRIVTDALAGVIGTEGAIETVDLLVNVARREAALRIAAHDWDQGCAAGCCDDSRGAEKASDLIMTTLTEEQRTELLDTISQD